MTTPVLPVGLNPTDLAQLDSLNISIGKVDRQLERFITGFPYLDINAPAVLGHGINSLDEIACSRAETRWGRYLSQGGDVVKMVPASGAASRMFKALFEYVDSGNDDYSNNPVIAQLLDNIGDFAFYDDLNACVTSLYGLDVPAMIAEGRGRAVVSALINPEGLGYGFLPKGLLKFHSYGTGETHTPVEEQLREGAQTIADARGNVNVEFTVSPEFRDKFEVEIERVVAPLSEATGLHFNVSLSEQKPSTDTIAVDAENRPLRVDDRLVFRPGGHGALIENLNDIDATVVFIKNIDNVVPDYHRDVTVRYKRVLGGYLIELHDRVAAALAGLNEADRDRLDDIVKMLERDFMINIPDTTDDETLRQTLRHLLDRPMRVCGMVKNEGEAGGGPFIINEPDGTTSLQILESSQIDKSDARAVEMLSNSTHFNPVDIVCYIKDVDGNKFYLPDYVDDETGFISSKSLHGVSLKALELPGLWNGAMSRWLTAFVEVPVETFNPVKTVNDLLRPVHRR